MFYRAALLTALAAAVSVAPAPSLRERVDAALVRRRPAIIEFRRDLHRHPELSGAEVRTSANIAAELRRLGFVVRTGIGGHGVVGILVGRRPGPLVAYRADIDAFPSPDPDPVAFASENPGVRHICGHDLHTAIALALAEALASVRNELPGRVMFVFQPAEERATGAKAMLAAGVFERELPVAIYALHTAPLPVGILGTRAGVLMGGRDAVNVTISGAGNIAAIADSVRQLLDGVSTVTMAQSVAPGPPDFVFADISPPRRVSDTTWLVQGTLSMADSVVRARTRASMLEQLARLTRPGVRVLAEYQERVIAGVTNDVALTARANAAMRSALGVGSVIDITDIFPAFSEDFGSFQQRVPGVFYFLGVSNAAKGTVGMPHTPEYVADEGAMLVGARAMASVMLDRLGQLR
jgi:metal-dependent amidase/aminoacylase/carboxypeptidase family protein